MRSIVRGAVRRVLVLAALWALFVNQLGAVTEGGVLGGPTMRNTSFVATGLGPAEFVPMEFVPVEFVPVEFVPVEFVPVEFVPVELERSGSCPAGRTGTSEDPGTDGADGCTSASTSDRPTE